MVAGGLSSDERLKIIVYSLTFRPRYRPVQIAHLIEQKLSNKLHRRYFEIDQDDILHVGKCYLYLAIITETVYQDGWLN